MKLLLTLKLALIVPFVSFSQLKWKNVDSLYQPLPPSIHVYFSNDSLDGKPNIAYYAEVNLKDKNLNFTTEVGNGKRYTPSQYYKNEGNPLLVVNSTFFEFVHNRNLNLVVKNKKILAYNSNSIPGRGKDTMTYRHPFASAIGINKKRKPDVAWTYTDTANRFVYAMQTSMPPLKDSLKVLKYEYAKNATSNMSEGKPSRPMKVWKMETAVGGGPVLLQNGEVKITNNEELKFSGKAIDDKHPRTAMGYTKDGKLIILMFQGRSPGIAEGASLKQQAKVFQSLGCWEALNLDGGGSSCLLINGKETIKPSDKEGQRPVPAVFVIENK
jgi:hypothetical protein